MKRSTSVTIAAFCSLVGSAAALALGLVSALSVMLARKSNPDLNEPIVLGGVAIGTVLLIVPSSWGVATSVGLLRLRSWARISILVFSVVLAGTGVLGNLLFPLIAIPSASFTVAKFGLAAFYTSLLGIGIWWFVLFSRPSVRQQYAGSASSFASPANQAALDRPRAQAAASGA